MGEAHSPDLRTRRGEAQPGALPATQPAASPGPPPPCPWLQRQLTSTILKRCRPTLFTSMRPSSRLAWSVISRRVPMEARPCCEGKRSGVWQGLRPLEARGSTPGPATERPTTAPTLKRLAVNAGRHSCRTRRRSPWRAPPSAPDPPHLALVVVKGHAKQAAAAPRLLCVDQPLVDAAARHFKGAERREWRFRQERCQGGSSGREAAGACGAAQRGRPPYHRDHPGAPLSSRHKRGE